LHWKPLPAEPYRYAEWKRGSVAPDYRIEIAGHYYSVPSRLIREVVEASITWAGVYVGRFLKGARPADLGGAAAWPVAARAPPECSSQYLLSGR
jgi:hypothetical protein